MPPLMSLEDRKALARNIGVYTQAHKIPNILVAFHGGEPLLMKVDQLIQTARWIREAASENTEVDISLQTNGVLVTDDILEKFTKENIGVSLSLDGPREATDLHRLTHKGRSSYDGAIAAYHKLKNYPSIFMGVIAVIDPRVKPRELLEFFRELNPPKLDFLLPDANHIAQPFMRNKHPDIYINWLLEAFDLWLDEFPNLKIRLFDTLLQAIVGSQSGTDFFGFGNVTMLTIETDGTYHDLDVLKITTEGYSSLGMNVREHSIEQAANSPNIAIHNKLLSFEGVSKTCQACPVVKICGGGSVPHRYGKNGFDNPTVYCQEMIALITHAQKKLDILLGNKIQKRPDPTSSVIHIDPTAYNQAKEDNSEVSLVYESWCDKAYKTFQEAIQYASQLGSQISDTVDQYKTLNTDQRKMVSAMPSVRLWVKTVLKHQQGSTIYDFDRKPLQLENIDLQKLSSIVSEARYKKLVIHPDDPWLRKPFGSKVVFEDDAFMAKGESLINKALHIVEDYNPALKKEILTLSPIISLIQDPNADPNSFVSFSDNEVPGTLFVCIRHNNSYASPHDLADSLIHEHRHQKLYLLEELCPVVTSNFPYVSSPWRKEPRPVSGLFHAAFVFNELEKFWRYVALRESGGLLAKAMCETRKNQRMLKEAFITLDKCPLSGLGKEFLQLFKKELQHDYIINSQQTAQAS